MVESRIRTEFENFTFLLLSALDAKKYGWCHFFYESYFYQILCLFHLFLDPALTAQSVHMVGLPQHLPRWSLLRPKPCTTTHEKSNGTIN